MQTELQATAREVERRLMNLEDDTRRATASLHEHLLVSGPLAEQQASMKATVDTLQSLVVGNGADGLTSIVKELKREVEAGRNDVQESLEAIKHLTRLIVGDGTPEYPGMVVSAAIKKASDETVKKIGWYVLSFATGGIATAAALTQFIDWLGK